MTSAIDAERNITLADLRFVGSDARPMDGEYCPACGGHGLVQPVLQVPSLTPPHDVLDLVRCGNCDSLFFPAGVVRDHAAVEEDGGEWGRYYVDVGGGVWEVIWPILVGRDSGSLLDVGCGYGFAVDFWRRTGRGDAIGVESAPYGREGASDLGVQILDRRLDDNEALADRVFDIVYASEVIEHVENPRLFAATLARHVAEDGELILTTPAAEYVEPRNASCVLLAALSPGYHAFLLSQHAFVDAVRSAGFAHVDVRGEGPRQVLRASRRPLAPWRDRDVTRREVYQYLSNRVLDRRTGSAVRLSFCYRMLRDLVSEQRWLEAVAVDDELVRELVLAHGSAVLDPVAAVEHYAGCRNARAIGGFGPHFLPSYFHLAALVAEHGRRDQRLAIDRARAALAAMTACGRHAPSLYVEAVLMYWSARLHYQALGHATIADDDEVFQEVASLVDASGVLGAAMPATGANSRTPERELTAIAENLASCGRWAAARLVSDAYRRYAAWRYGAVAMTVGAIESALASGVADLPLEPLFVPWFDVLVELAEASTNSSGRERARNLVAIAEARRWHPRHGAALAAFAARARERAGLAPPPPIVSFETSFTIAPRRR